MRSRFDEQLDQLNRELIEMGALCEEVIAAGRQGPDRRGIRTLAEQVPPLDRGDRPEGAGDRDRCACSCCCSSSRWPGDLRQISAALKMITDMERIGDQAEDIAEIVPAS